MAQVGFYHANILAMQINESISQQIASRDSEFLAILQHIPTLVSTSTDSSNSDTKLILEHQANTASNNAVQLEILKLLKELSQDIKQTKVAVPRCRPAQKTPNGKHSLPRIDTSKYCWTHGAGNYSSSEYNHRTPGHKQEAVLGNKMGSSIAYYS